MKVTGHKKIVRRTRRVWRDVDPLKATDYIDIAAGASEEFGFW